MEMSSEDVRLHALPISLEKTFQRTMYPSPSKIVFNFLYMYELYSVCASLLCEIKKMKQYKNMTWDEMWGLKHGVGECDGGVLITSFKLPVLSCSQPLKIITRVKNTIYNVLAIDRCSTCVTVLIYETKMVTVNYVFLCGFFKWGAVGEDALATTNACVLLFLVEYNGNHQFHKKTKKYINIFFS